MIMTPHSMMTSISKGAMGVRETTQRFTWSAATLRIGLQTPLDPRRKKQPVKGLLVTDMVYRIDLACARWSKVLHCLERFYNINSKRIRICQIVGCSHYCPALHSHSLHTLRKRLCKRCWLHSLHVYLRLSCCGERKRAERETPGEQNRDAEMR